MQLLTDYFELQQRIYTYFGYVEEWQVFPLEDSTKYWWFISNTCVHFATTREKLNDEEERNMDELFHYRGTSQAVFEGEEYTLIVVDTYTDGNKFLSIFDNKKRVRDISL